MLSAAYVLPRRKVLLSLRVLIRFSFDYLRLFVFQMPRSNLSTIFNMIARSLSSFALVEHQVSRLKAAFVALVRFVPSYVTKRISA